MTAERTLSNCGNVFVSMTFPKAMAEYFGITPKANVKLEADHDKIIITRLSPARTLSQYLKETGATPPDTNLIWVSSGVP